jgi:inhibitor of cysteine peptidase
MERKLFSLLTAGLLFCVAVLGWNQAGRAAMCGKCRDLLFIDSEGKCSDCGAPTASAALKLCPKCSARRHQCEHCLAPTTASDEAAARQRPADSAAEKPRGGDSPSGDAQDGPPLAWTAPANSSNPVRPDDAAARPTGSEISPTPAKTLEPAPLERLPESKPPAELPPNAAAPIKFRPINPAKAGTYTSGNWRYQLQIASPGTRSEGRWGWLTYNGQKLPRGEVNDYYDTPWGPIYWVDVPMTVWGVHGWMPAPLAQGRRHGRALTLPSSMLAAASIRPGTPAPLFPTPPTPQGTAAPQTPRAQTLEINKSHNGQVARLRVGNVLVIRLPGNPATGYQWQAATANSPALRLTVRPQYSPPAPTAGQAAVMGTYIFTFQAVQPGSGSIRLYYVRPDDPRRPRDAFAVGVNVSPATVAARPAAATLPAAGR